MATLKDIIKKIAAKLGDAEKTLAAELEAAANETTSDLEEARQNASEASKKLKAAEKDRDKFKTDLEAKSKGEGDELAKLRTERDQLKAAAEKHAAETSELHREYKLREALGKAGLRDADAIKMLDTSSVTVDDKGNLMGLDKALKGWKDAKPYLFEDTAPNTTGNSGEKPPKPGDGKGAGGPNTKEPTADDMARQMLIQAGYLAAPAPAGTGSAPNGGAGAGFGGNTGSPWGF